MRERIAQVNALAHNFFDRRRKTRARRVWAVWVLLPVYDLSLRPLFMIAL
jgi:hypothetical protein